MSSIINKCLCAALWIIVAVGICVINAKPSPFSFPEDSNEQSAYPAVVTTTRKPLGTIQSLSPASLPKRKGNYKIVRGKDGKLRPVSIEGRGDGQRKMTGSSSAIQMTQGVHEEPARGHMVMYANNTRGKRDTGQIFFPTGPSPQPDLRNCMDTYCTQVPNYPSDYVAQLLRNQASGFKEFFGEDVVISPNISQRFDTGSFEETLCYSTEVLVYPKMAQTRDDQWKLVVNEEQYKQGVRVERCLNANSPCRFADSFGYGYKTECQQRYIYRQLLSLNDQNQLTKEVFKLPSCCKCIIKQVNTQSRFGDQSPARRKRSVIPTTTNH